MLLYDDPYEFYQDISKVLLHVNIFLHDFAITPNWAIFLQNAIKINPFPFLFGLKGAAQCLSSQSIFKLT